MPHTPASLASRFINSTGRHVFLTGKAGTGKTTFLKELVQHTHKKTVVAAPTGIAAINAGGVTLHSLFQLPFGAFLPSEEGLAGRQINIQLTTPKSLIGKLKLHATRRKLLREMELLVIDEVSMLRADLLDAIDTVLRYVHRKRNLPFGGVQLLFIGDMLQLPPVVKNDEWEFLRLHYPGMYFFQAHALRKNPPLYIELGKIYRQTDPRFISLLNNLREGILSESDRQLLSQHVKPTFDPTKEEGYIFLTTHNHKADLVNGRALQKINKPEYSFRAQIENNFPESMYPMEHSLVLKEGAQVMFIKNDYSGERRYFNGKIGVVDEISDEGIRVKFSDGWPSAEVERYTWENKKFSVNEASNEIEEKVAGTFTQYPLKLAWSVTIHKSQGLTFDKAVIDVSAAFAPGQIYVALSRLTGLGGLILSAPLPQDAPGIDNDLLAFTSGRPASEELAGCLETESMRYLHQHLANCFDFQILIDEMKWHVDSYNKEEGRSAKQQQKQWALSLMNDTAELKEVGDRFLSQLVKMAGNMGGQSTKPPPAGKQLKLTPTPVPGEEIGMPTGSNHPGHAVEAPTEASGETALKYILERVNAAAAYFNPKLKAFSYRIFGHIDNLSELSGVKAYVRELHDLESAFFGKQQMILKAMAMIRAIMENTELTKQQIHDPAMMAERTLMTRPKKKERTPGGKPKVVKPPPGKKSRSRRNKVKDAGGDTPSHEEKEKKISSAEVSCLLFKEGLSIEKIAAARSLAETTIEIHLAKGVEEGLLDASQFISGEKCSQILMAAEMVGSTRAGDIMAVLGDEFSYADIRFALASMRRKFRS